MSIDNELDLIQVALRAFPAVKYSHKAVQISHTSDIAVRTSLVPIRCRECGPSVRRRFKIHDRTLPTTSGAFGRQNHQSSHSVTLCKFINIFSPTQMLILTSPDMKQSESLPKTGFKRCTPLPKSRKSTVVLTSDDA